MLLFPMAFFYVKVEIVMSDVKTTYMGSNQVYLSVCRIGGSSPSID